MTGQVSERLSNVDKGIANSPCHENPGLQGCDAQEQEKIRYTANRTRIKKYLEQLSADLEKNESAILAINKQAGN